MAPQIEVELGWTTDYSPKTETLSKPVGGRDIYSLWALYKQLLKSATRKSPS